MICTELFEQSGSGSALTVKGAIKDASDKAITAARALCTGGCKHLAIQGATSIDVEFGATQWTAKYTGAFTCFTSPNTAADAQENVGQCYREFTVRVTTGAANTAKSEALVIAESTCQALDDCKKLDPQGPEKTSVLNNRHTYERTYKCIKEVPPTGR